MFLEGVDIFGEDKVERERFARVIQNEIEKIQEKQKTEQSPQILEYYKITIEGFKYFIQIARGDK